MKTEQGQPRQKEQHGQRLRGSEAVQSGRRLNARLGGCGSGPSGQKGLCHKGTLLEVPVLHLECQRWSLGGDRSQELI